MTWGIDLTGKGDSAGYVHAIFGIVAAIAALPPVQEEFWFEAWDGLLTEY